MTCVAMGLPMSSSALRGKALLSKAAPAGCLRRGLAGGVRSSADEHQRPLLRDSASRAALLCASISSSASLLVHGAAAASAVVAKQQASAENLTVPVFLSLLLAGAVYGASTDPSLRRLVEESTKPTKPSSGEPVKEPLASTSSESKPSSALAGRAMPQLAAAVKVPEPPAVLALERPEAAALPASKAPLASVASAPAQAPAPESAQPVEVPPVEAAVMRTVAAEPAAAASASAAMPVSITAAPVEDTAASPRVQSFFEHAAEGARKMQAQYGEKIAGVRAQMARREQEEVRRRELRQAKISSLQAAAAAEAPAQPARQPHADHTQGPLARIMGLAVSLWLWVKHHVEKLLGHSSSGSSSSGSSGSSNGVAPSSA